MLALLVVARVAAADPGEDAYAEGRRLYDLQEWDQAIEKFKESYKLRSDGPSLFNIAQAYRLKGDCDSAVRTYKTYKRNFPEAQNIAVVDKLLAELEPCPAAGTKPVEKPIDDKPVETTPVETTPVETTPVETKPVETAPVETKAENTPVETRPSDARGEGRLWTWVALGSTALFTTTAIYFGRKSNAEFDEYKTTTDQARVQGPDPLDGTGRALLENTMRATTGSITTTKRDLVIAAHGYALALTPAAMDAPTGFDEQGLLMNNMALGGVVATAWIPPGTYEVGWDLDAPRDFAGAIAAFDVRYQP